MVGTTVGILIPRLTANNLPDDLKQRMAQAAAKAFRDRIRKGSKTFDNQPLDPNSIAWREKKLSGNTDPRAISDFPLVMTGAMTDDKKAWSFSYRDNTIVLEMVGLAREHAISVIQTAIRTGRNWQDAFKAGEFEESYVIQELLKWLRKNGKRLIGASVG